MTSLIPNFKSMTWPPIAKDKLTIWPFVVGLAFLIIGFGVAIYNFSGFRGLLIIHFDSFRGIDFLGDKGDVFKILGLGIIVLVINAVLAHEFYWKERFLSYVLSFGTAIFSLLILMAIIAIISIN